MKETAQEIRRRYEDKVKCTPEVQESNCGTSELGLQTEEESPQLEPALQPRTDADEDIPSCRDNKDNSGSQKQAEVIRTFPVGKIQDLSTDRSRSR